MNLDHNFEKILNNNNCFYHSSKKGIEGKIRPDFNDKDKKRDFGDGFYLGDKKLQTISLVNSYPNAKLYEIEIPKDIMNKDNTLFLTKNDWVYYVLYNRGYLQPVKDTYFYNYYANISNDKDFVIGSIADDVFSTCMKDFANGVITDYMFMQLIDCYSYGNQIAAKTNKACESLIIKSEKALTTEDRMNSLSTRKMTRATQETDYIQRRAKLLIERKGQFIGEIFDDILKKKKEITSPYVTKDIRNLYFETPIHDMPGF